MKFSRNARIIGPSVYSPANILDALGEKALADTAATVAAFNAYPRMADATGIPLENAKENATMEMRIELGIESLKHS